jgi:hypothetical protein
MTDGALIYIYTLDTLYLNYLTQPVTDSSKAYDLMYMPLCWAHMGGKLTVRIVKILFM